MLRVIIADDEEHLCLLIKALIEWEELGLELAAIAHNGIEAEHLVKELKPDILITDIQMPGSNGLELIKNVKSQLKDLEIVIISGYAHFEYAQTAMQYGVGDYLLKPIDKAELCTTLKKLADRIREKRQQELEHISYRQKSEQNIIKLQMNMMESLWQGKEQPLSLDILKTEYHLNIQPGIFQCFCMKIDGDIFNLKNGGLAIVTNKEKNILENCLQRKVHELVVYTKDTYCIGFINYEEKNGKDITWILRDCLNQMEAQKDIFGGITFTVAIGGATSVVEEIPNTFREAGIIIKNRLLSGTGRVLEHMPEKGVLYEQGLLEKYLHNIAKAIEVISVEKADEAVRQMSEAVSEAKNIYGYEIYDLVTSCGKMFLSEIEFEDLKQTMYEFEERCDCCGSEEELFTVLMELQRVKLADLAQKRENELNRPIRQAKRYIMNHYSEPINMEEISEKVGLSSAYFSALFKKTEGEGFAKYLIRIRMEEAKTLLRETNCNVAEVCRRVGYNDLKHFNKTFEKHTGVKPGMYRKLYG
ncbi:MAG: response regulator [Lachnospiraceae bacterium]|nr:response regulator [Lachnospiraceae bacterium]